MVLYTEVVRALIETFSFRKYDSLAIYSLTTFISLWIRTARYEIKQSFNKRTKNNINLILVIAGYLSEPRGDSSKPVAIAGWAFHNFPLNKTTKHMWIYSKSGLWITGGGVSRTITDPHASSRTVKGILKKCTWQT